MLPYRTSSNFNPASPQLRDCPFSAPLIFGSHIFSIHKSEDIRKDKQLKKQTYYQELTRQIQEKLGREPAEKVRDSLPVNLPQLPYPWDGRNLPKHQKKYQIENHSSFYGNQVLGGALQRDEIQLLKDKKQQQQKEMQEFLKFQVEEKQRLNDTKKKHEEIRNNHEREMNRNSPFGSNEMSSFRYLQTNHAIKDNNQLSHSESYSDKESNTASRKSLRRTFVCKQLSQNQLVNTDTDNSQLTCKEVSHREMLTIDDEIKDHNFLEEEADASKQQQEIDETNQEIEKLSLLCQELMNKQEKLWGKISVQEGVIEEMKVKEEDKLVAKPKGIATRISTATNRSTFKIKHETGTETETETAKLSATNSRVENSKMRKIEIPHKRKESGTNAGIVRGNNENIENLNDTGIFSINSALVRNQWNLDVSAKSTFIYPNDQGFYVQGTRQNEDLSVHKFNATSSFTLNLNERRTSKPMIAKGFPPGVFILP